jgi:hypothetical protein
MQNHVKKIAYFFLIVAILIVYWQVQGFGFINFDDPSYITQNRYVKNGLTYRGISWAFTEFHSGNWHPVTWMSHMLDVQLLVLWSPPSLLCTRFMSNLLPGFQNARMF